MKRLIQYHDKINDNKGEFSDCSTDYKILGLYSDEAGAAVLENYAKQYHIKTVGDVFTPSSSPYKFREIKVTHALKLEASIEINNSMGAKKPCTQYLGLVDLNFTSKQLLPPTELLNTDLTKDQAEAILNAQIYGIDGVGETVGGERVLVKSGWHYYHQLPLLGYSLESFDNIMGITQHSFYDEVSSCHGCGLYADCTDLYKENFKIVDECELFGIECGCYHEYCVSSDALAEFVNNPTKAMELTTCETLENDGRLKFVERFIGGLVDGRGGHFGGEYIKEGTPRKALQLFKAAYPKADFVFSHDESGQFQAYFSIWQIVPNNK